MTTDEFAAQMEALGLGRRELISTVDGGRNLFQQSAAQEAGIRLAAKNHAAHAIKNADASKSGKLKQWNNPDTFGSDKLAEKMENRYSGQGHRDALEERMVQNRSGSQHDHDENQRRAQPSRRSQNRSVDLWSGPAGSDSNYALRPLKHSHDPGRKRAPSPRAAGTTRFIHNKRISSAPANVPRSLVGNPFARSAVASSNISSRIASSASKIDAFKQLLQSKKVQRVNSSQESAKGATSLSLSRIPPKASDRDSLSLTAQVTPLASSTSEQTPLSEAQLWRRAAEVVGNEVETKIFVQVHPNGPACIQGLQAQVIQEVVDFSDSPDSIQVKNYRKFWPNRVWLLDLAINARAGILPDGELNAAARAVLRKLDIPVKKMTKKEPSGQPPAVKSNERNKKEKSTQQSILPTQVSSPVNDGASHHIVTTAQVPDSASGASSARVKESTLGTFTTEYYDASGRLVHKQERTLAISVQATLSIRSKARDCSPLQFASEMNTYALRMIERSNSTARFQMDTSKQPHAEEEEEEEEDDEVL